MKRSGHSMRSQTSARNKRPVLSEAEALSLQVRKLLTRRGQDVQGAVLIDLVSMFIAGHAALKPGDPPKGPWSAETLAATREIRVGIFTEFMRCVDALIPVSAKQMGAPHDPIDPDPENYARTALTRH